MNTANLEIERKFLACGEFKAYAYHSERIKQAYLSIDPERSVRIRQKGNKAYITIKGKSDQAGLRRFEWEKEITINEASLLFKLSLPNSNIDKTRYYIKTNDNLEFEVDEFHEENEGLIIAEIELQNENQQFDKPMWLGKEVTGDNRYYNSALSQNPYIKWQQND